MFEGKAAKSTSGITKDKLVMNKCNVIVSKVKAANSSVSLKVPSP